MAGPRLLQQEVETLIERHSAGLRRFLIGVLKDADLADEALQQTCVTALERIQQADPATHKGWLYKVAFHHALELRRRGQRARRTQEALAMHAALLHPTPPRDPELAARAAEALARAQAAIARLPAPQREVLGLRLHDGLTFSDIAARLRVPLGTALTRMRLALDRLRHDLKGIDP